MRDTLSLNFETNSPNNASNSNNILESVVLYFNVENGFPFDAYVKVFMMDSISGIALDSLDLNLLDAAAVNLNGRVEATNIQRFEVELDQNQVQSLIDANQAIISITLSTFAYETTAVKLYTDYTFVLGVSMLSSFKNE
tara:strand:- start:205 stop:621 length:417 start_codon:yes stop_codon:yes gene_type:complete